MFTFSILHTSARPDKWKAVYDQWLSQADSPDLVQYILVGDPRWGFNKYNHVTGLRDQDIYLSLAPSRRCYVEGVNLAARYAQGHTFIVNADDQFPCPHWDTELYRVISLLPGIKNDPKLEFSPSNIDHHVEYVIRVNTGTPSEVERNITVMPILSKSRYQRLGYIFHPGYESMYADNDLTEHAQMDGCFVDANSVESADSKPGDRAWLELPDFPHQHPIVTGQSMDEQYQVQNRKEAYELGANLLNIRRATKFGTAPIQIPTAQAQAQRKTIAVCLPGETFSSTVMSSWTGLLVNLFSRFNVVPIFCHVSNVHVTRGVLAEQVIQNINTEPKPDYVLWIDDDNPVHWEHVNQLLIDLDHVPEADMVAGWCWIWDQLNNKFVVSCGHLNESNSTCLSHTLETLADSEFDLLPIGYSGFPLVLMRASVLTRLKERYKHPFAPIYDANHPWGAMSEDTAFCKRVQDLGMRMFVDRRVRVDHLKTVAHGPAIKIIGRHQLVADSGQTVLPAAETNPVTAVEVEKERS